MTNFITTNRMNDQDTRNDRHKCSRNDNKRNDKRMKKKIIQKRKCEKN